MAIVCLLKYRKMKEINEQERTEILCGSVECAQFEITFNVNLKLSPAIDSCLALGDVPDCLVPAPTTQPTDQLAATAATRFDNFQ